MSGIVLDVTDPALSLRIGYPVPAPQHAALLSCYDLVLTQAAEAVVARIPGRPGECFLEDWEIARAALLARMAGTVRHLGYLVPSNSRHDGVALTRTLLDHAIHYAWIAASPADRLPRFLRKTYANALTKHERMAARGIELLNPELLAHYRGYIADHREGTGRLHEMAKDVDDSWLDRVRAAAPAPLQMPSMDEYYAFVYDQFANLDHPSTVGLQSYVHLDADSPAAWVDGVPEADRDMDQRPYWLALWIMCWALLVASVSQSRPALSQLQETIGQARRLREFDRHGLLVVTESDDGVTVGLVPDADARIEEIAATHADG